MNDSPSSSVKLAATVSIVLFVLAACTVAPRAEENCRGPLLRFGKSFYENNVPYLDRRDDAVGWPMSAPESQGLDRRRLDAGADVLSGNSSVRSVAVVRDGRLAYERYLNGGSVDESNNVHSVSKGIVQALLAIAIERGFIRSLDDPVSRYLPDYPNADVITLRSLIEMRSGLRWTEDITEYRIQQESDWVGAILGQGIGAPPGTVFNYSTGNTHILSAVIQAATGTSTCQFAENLLGPLGITVEHWGIDPQGIYSGGYNFYITTREMARFGLLYLNNGAFGGQQLVPEWAIRAAAEPPGVGSNLSYSQGWWTRRIAGLDMYFAWGHGGQFVYVIPDIQVVLVISQNTRRTNWEVDSAAFIEQYLLPAMS